MRAAADGQTSGRVEAHMKRLLYGSLLLLVSCDRKAPLGNGLVAHVRIPSAPIL